MTNSVEQTTTLKISGMTCGSCQRRVQAALAAVPGVRHAEVDYTRGVAELRYDPTIAAPAMLARAVRDAGYGVGASGDDGAPTKGGCGCGCSK